MKIAFAFLSVVAIWSTTPLAIKWSAEGAPFASVAIRMVIGMVFCMCLIWLFKTPFPVHSRAKQLYFASGISIYLSMCLVYWSANSIPSGWIAVLFGLSPIITGGLSSLVETEQALTRLKVIGIALGVLGLCFIFANGLTFNSQTSYSIATVMLAVLVASSSSIWIRHLSKDQNIAGIATATGGLIFAAPLFLITALVAGKLSVTQFSMFALTNILYLGIVGSGFGFTLYYFLLKNVSATRVALITLITPVTSLLIGNWLNNEPLTSQLWLGTACICTGLVCYEYKPKLGLRALQ